MRIEPYASDSYVHVTKRGARGMPLATDDADRWRFLRLLRYLNDTELPRQWERDLERKNLEDNFERPAFWPDQAPMVHILAFCFVHNHFHLLLKEAIENGIPQFMQRLGDSMTGHFNKKYNERGSIFQGAYHLRRIEDDASLRYVAAYIQIKNTLDACSVTYERQHLDVDQLLDTASKYRFSSLPEYLHTRNLPIVSKELLGELWDTPAKVRSYTRDFIEGRRYLDDAHKDLWME